MSGNATKLISIGFSVILTSMLITYGVVAFSKMQEVENSSIESASTYLSQMQTQILTDISGNTLSGIEAINYVKQFGDVYLIEVIDSSNNSSQIYNNVKNAVNAINQQKAYKCELKRLDENGIATIVSDKSVATVISFSTIDNITQQKTLDLSKLADLLAGTDYQLSDDSTNQDLIDSFIAYIQELRKNQKTTDVEAFALTNGTLTSGITEIDFIPTDIIIYRDSFSDSTDAYYLNLSSVFDTSDAIVNDDGFLKKISVYSDSVDSETKNVFVCLQLDSSGSCKKCWIENEFDNTVALYYRCIRIVRGED